MSFELDRVRLTIGERNLLSRLKILPALIIGIFLQDGHFVIASGKHLRLILMRKMVSMV